MRDGGIGMQVIGKQIFKNKSLLETGAWTSKSVKRNLIPPDVADDLFEKMTHLKKN